MSDKEMAAHVRKRLRASGIAARCYLGSARSLAVQPVKFDDRFTESEQAEILLIASANRLTLTRGLPIDLSERTYGKGAWFEIGG